MDREEGKSILALRRAACRGARHDPYNAAMIEQRFPATRMRRNRMQDFARRMTREHRLAPADLIQPLFVAEGDLVGPVASMPGIQRRAIDALCTECARVHALGIPAVAIFPVLPAAEKNARGDSALDPEGLVPRAIKAVKQAVPELGVIVDIALDPFTDHGHDGLLRADGSIDNDATVEVLTRQAILYARAGADVLAPSDMMDGRVGALRTALERDGRFDTLILSYAAKYASGFYGPFRDAVGSRTALIGDKRSYQMDPANGDEALREIALDLREGADWVMVKPGMPYLDIVARAKAEFGVPVAAYQVSGEYAMLEAAAAAGALDRRRAIMESLLCFRRAGADMILSYFAAEAAEWLTEPGA
jgi:porphobilinogen synthase